MSRDGFTRADIDTAYLNDEKVRRLWRLVDPDVSLMCECVMIHEATLLASWKSGHRVTASEAAPLWFPTPIGEAITGPLVLVGLLDRAQRIPIGPFKRWFLPALERKAKRAEAGRIGGLASAQSRAERAPNGRRSKRSPSLNPTNQPSNHPASAPARARRARQGGGPTSLADAIAETPFGQAHAARRGDG